jgi:putative serine protease PepD
MDAAPGEGWLGMRGLWWSAVLISGLLGGIAGAALMFGLTQAFGGSSSGGHTTVVSNGVRTTGSRTDAQVARNGLDAGAIYDKVRPSVVTIDTTTLRRRGRDDGEGTGIVLDTSGHILTNNHVIDQVNKIDVTLSDGHSYTGKVLATDPDNDLAVVGISAPTAALHPATLGDANQVHIGDPVVAIGNPLGYEASLTEGIVSGLDRTFDDGQSQPMNHLLQSDAAINPGNSGGPLLNGRGEVIGVNTLLDNADGSDSFAGLGFAVPIGTAKSIIDQAKGK